ncbi:hypothetical protein [Enterococcus sp. AZ192]|uniref:hypothetical protein n=1 Tax=unclassified Enterococcus TaxID=2608891 RepID=UPI003D280C9F
MEYLELIFENIKVNDIEKILNEFKFKPENIESSHFFIDNEDKEYRDITSFSQYFKNKGTCNLLVRDIDLGTVIKKSIIIISFDETYGDITFTFSENDWEKDNISDDEKANILFQKLSMIKNNINYSSILFGYDPVDEEDMQLFRIDNNSNEKLE